MKKKIITFAVVATAVIAALMPGMRAAFAQGTENDISVDAKAYLIADFETGTEIASYAKDERLPIASMVKIMTLDLLFEKIDEGTLSLDEYVCVSENARSMGGSQAYLDAGENYKAEELIKSIIVASANDSCVAMAEHVAGGVENFVAMMNDKAESLGMHDTNFVNCTGLPAPGEYSTASDVLKMTRDLMRHKEFFDYSGIWMFDFVHPSGRKTTLTNTNKLSRFYEGCDGGKTGYTSQALSCLSATAKRGDTRLLCVVIGAPSSKIRNAEVSKLFNFAFANYVNEKVFSYNDSLRTTEVAGGTVSPIKISAAEEVYDFHAKNADKSEVEVKFVPTANRAPVAKGEKIGVFEIYKNGVLIKSVDAVAEESSDKKDFMDTLRDIAEKW